MTAEILDFIMGSLVDTDKYIEVVDSNFVTAKETRELTIEMRDNNENPSLLRAIAFYWHQTCVNDYFPLLR